jgi:hypothetical protein
MDERELLIDLFGRVSEHVRDAVEGLDADVLSRSPGPGTNSIGWLIWHLTRVQDHHVADLLDEDQVWCGGDWAARMGLKPDPDNTGFGHGPGDVATVRPDGWEVLLGYYEIVAARTASLLGQLTPDDLDRIVDRRWDPPVTLGVRLISVADDDIQHAGQAAFIRGLFGE